MSAGAPPDPDRSRRFRWGFVAVAVAVVAALVAVLLTALAVGGTKSVTVTLEPVNMTPSKPFTASVVTASAGGKQPFTTSLPASAHSGAAVHAGPLTLRPVAGDQSSLYGTNPSAPVCDSDRLISLIEANPAVTHVWAETMGVPTSAIAATVHSLSPVVLGQDTAVTDHIYDSSGVLTFQAILEAGTAVLVDAHGVPRVQCSCGNPLAQPAVTSSHVQLKGDRWPDFDPTKVITVAPSPKPVPVLKTIDITTNQPVTVGVGNSVSLNGYLVSNAKGVSVVSFDDKKATQIIDHPVAKAIDDGAGGLIYQDLHTGALRSTVEQGAEAPRLSPSTVVQRQPANLDEAAIWHLSAGATTPVKLIAPANWRRSWYSIDGIVRIGQGTQVIYDTIAASSSSNEPQRVFDLGTSKSTTLQRAFDKFNGKLTSITFVGGSAIAVVSAGGTTSEYRLNSDGSEGPLVCQGKTEDIYDSFCADLLGVLPGGEVLIRKDIPPDDESAVLAVARAQSGTVVRTIPNTRHPLCEDICPAAGRSSDLLGLRFLSSAFTYTNDGITPVPAWPYAATRVVDLSTGSATALPFAGQIRFLRAPIIRPARTGSSAETTTTSTTTLPTTTSAPTSTSPSTTIAPTTIPSAPSIDLQQVASGNYTSLAGTWIEVASFSTMFAAGPLWQSGGSDTLSISPSKITLGDVWIQGSTLTDDSNGRGAEALIFHNYGNYIEAGLVNQDVAINWVFDFYPSGSVDLNTKLNTNNGVGLDNSIDTIVIWSSNNNFTEVFDRAG